MSMSRPMLFSLCSPSSSPFHLEQVWLCYCSSSDSWSCICALFMWSYQSIPVLLPLVPVIGYRAVLGLSGYLISNIAFVFAAVYFYRSYNLIALSLRLTWQGIYDMLQTLLCLSYSWMLWFWRARDAYLPSVLADCFKFNKMFLWSDSNAQCLCRDCISWEDFLFHRCACPMHFLLLILWDKNNIICMHWT